MAGQHGHSEACCTVPAVQHDYKEKGKYIDVDGTRTYAVGPASADTALLYVFDIFGFKPQSLQGADILAHTDDEHHQYQVFVPDFFNGDYADTAWFPPDTKEKEEKLGNFFKGTGNPADAVKRVPQLVDAITKQSGGTIKKWGIVGFCWGGKVTALSTTQGSKFSAAAVAHPAMVDPKDAPGISVPFALLPSGDESMDDVRAFEKELKVPSLVEEYPDQVHGWMGARGDLKDDNVVKNYQKGYKTVLDWFHKHL